MTVRLAKSVKTAIRNIPDDAWEGIEYPQATWDGQSKRWMSKVEVAEVTYECDSLKWPRLER